MNLTGKLDWLRERYDAVDIAVIALATFLIWDAYHDADFVLQVNGVSFYAMSPWLQDVYVGCHFLMAWSMISLLLFRDKIKVNIFLHILIASCIITEIWLYTFVAEPAGIPVFWFRGISLPYGYWVAWIIARYVGGWVITVVWDFFVP